MIEKEYTFFRSCSVERFRKKCHFDRNRAGFPFLCKKKIGFSAQRKRHFSRKIIIIIISGLAIIASRLVITFLPKNRYCPVSGSSDYT